MPLVGEVKDEKIQPVPEKNERQSSYDFQKLGRGIVSQKRAGESGGHAEQGVGENESCKVATGKKPQRFGKSR